MIDSCGRNIDYLRLSVTDLCNYRCRYCMPEEGVCKRTHSEILSLEELEAIARAAVALGITKIRLAENRWYGAALWSCAAGCEGFRSCRSCASPPTEASCRTWQPLSGKRVWTG